jgi:cardiolipin synthase
MSTPVLTIANQLTILRMALSPFLVVSLVWREYTWALVVLLAAGITDLLDGLIARRGQQKTALGATLDPVADKILLGSAFVALTWNSALLVKIPVWLTVISLSRDGIILVSAVIINLMVGRRVFAPSLLGKISTGCQIATAGVVILLNALGRSHPALFLLFVVTLLFTVASAGHYVFLMSERRAIPSQE